jgi:hypothetical protein
MAEEIVFKTTVDTGNSVSAINNVDKALKEVDQTAKSTGTDVNKSFEDLNKKVESGELTVRQLTKAVREYATIAVQAAEDSPVGQEAIKRAGELKDRLGDLQTTINAAANDGRNMQTALQVGQGVASGYAVAQGAMALFGNESKDLQKTLVKLQAVQAVLVGLEEIRAILEKESLVRIKAKLVWDKVKVASEYAYTTAIGTSTGALKLARLAMLALPIVAIIAGIVAIAGAMGAFSSSTEDARLKQKALNEEMKKDVEQMEGIVKARQKRVNQSVGERGYIEQEIKLMKAKGATAQEINDKEKELFNKKIENIKEEGRLLDQSNKYGKARAWKLYNEIQELKRDEVVRQAEFNKTINEQNDASAEEAKKNKDKRDAEKLSNDKLQAEKRLELARTIEDLIIANIKDSDLRQLEELRVRHERERKELISKFGNDTVLIKELTDKQNTELSELNKEILQARSEVEKEQLQKDLDIKNRDEKARLEAKLINIREDFELEQELKKELADLELEQDLQREDLTNGEIEKLKAEHEAKLYAIKKEGVDKEKALNEEAVKQGFDITEKSLESIQNLSDIYFDSKKGKLEKGSKEEEKYARKQFELNKAMQIAGAVVDGAKAVTASLALSPVAIGTIPNPVGIASLALAVSSSVASIAKIASTKFGGTGGGGVNTPSIPTNNGGGADANATQANNMGNVSQVSSVGLIDNSNGIKVTVVDSEIKAVMDASAQTNVVSTIGG